MQKYANFDVLINKIGDDSTYSLSVHDAPTGNVDTIIAISSQAFANLLPHNLTALDNEETKRLGKQLYDIFFDNDAGQLLSTSLQHTTDIGVGLRLRLRLPTELAHLPWELLLNPKDDSFFALSTSTPIVRFLPVEHSGISIDPTKPLQVLVILPSYQGPDLPPLDGESEWESIRKAFTQLTEQQQVEVERLDPPTLAALQDRLRQKEYHVLHFSGHGHMDPASGQGNLIFQDDSGAPCFVSADKLHDIVRGHESIALAFLNACESGHFDSRNVFSGIAQRLVQGGLRAAIAMQTAISDKSSVVLSEVFYEVLTEGYTIDAALAEARIRVRTFHPAEWGVPLLFTRIDGPLIPLVDPDIPVEPPSEFIISDHELERCDKVFVTPDTSKIYNEAIETLRKERFLVLQGNLGVGKRTLALALAREIAQTESKNQTKLQIIQTFRNTSIKDLRQLKQRSIIIPDALGLFEWERKEIEVELPLLEELCKNNYVIMTTSSEVLEEALQETRLREWEPLRTCMKELTLGDYSASAYREMFVRHVEWAEQQGKIHKHQRRIIDQFLKSDQEFDWGERGEQAISPIDIRRLIDERVPRLRRQEDLTTALNELGNLQEEISRWFNLISEQPNLNDDLQCFVFALALFDGFDRQALWHWYQEIVKNLKQLNRWLSIRPLGTMVKLTEPYITSDGGIPNFTHPSYQRAVLNAIAESYREYFIELLPIFSKAAIPNFSGKNKVSSEESKAIIAETQPQREAITQALTYLAPYDFDELRNYVESLAEFRQGTVSAFASDIIVAAASNPGQRRQVFRFLQQWTNNHNIEGRSRRWVAALTYGKLAKMAPRRAMDGLQALCDDRSWSRQEQEENRFVKSIVARAARSLIPIFPEECRELYKDLAAYWDDYTRRAVSNELRRVAYDDPDFVEEILDDWSPLSSRYRLWTLVRTCIIIPGPLKTKRLSLLTEYISSELHLCNKAMHDALREESRIHPDRAWNLLRELIEHSASNAERIVTLATLIEDQESELSWKRLEAWATHERPIFNLAAAHIISHWRRIYPEKARPIAAILAEHRDWSISEMATTQPQDPIPTDFVKWIAKAPLDISTKDTPPRTNGTGTVFDFSNDILG